MPSCYRWISASVLMWTSISTFMHAFGGLRHSDKWRTLAVTIVTGSGGVCLQQPLICALIGTMQASLPGSPRVGETRTGFGFMQKLWTWLSLESCLCGILLAKDGRSWFRIIVLNSVTGLQMTDAPHTGLVTLGSPGTKASEAPFKLSGFFFSFQIKDNVDNSNRWYGRNI